MATPKDLGLYLRDQRNDLGLTQAQLCAAAAVSRRWLSDLESGKPTAEIGLIFRVLHALGVTLDASPTAPAPDGFDLDDVLRG
jgi:y4mF family transcriptional regulator